MRSSSLLLGAFCAASAFAAPGPVETIVEPAPAPAPVVTQAPAPAPAPQGGENQVFTFSTAWTWGGGQEPAPTTLATTTASGAAPTNAYQQAVLYNHNVHRSNHSASSLSWSDSLQKSAQALAQQCVYKHDTSIDGGGYGQNIGYGVESGNIGQMISNLMYNDEMGFFQDLYGVDSPDMSKFDSWGHFSQIVWKGSTEVGCATVTCNNLGNVDSTGPSPFTVCNYNPPGNYAGQYAANVLKPLGQAIFSV